MRFKTKTNLLSTHQQGQQTIGQTRRFERSSLLVIVVSGQLGLDLINPNHHLAHELEPARCYWINCCWITCIDLLGFGTLHGLVQRYLGLDGWL